MLKSLFPKIEWKKIKVIGFDMDGTLYDEFEFIEQVYRPISSYLSASLSRKQDDIYSWMLRRWLEKGSSYPYIFKESILRFSEEKDDARLKEMIAQCLSIYRNFTPSLSLSPRVRTILDILKTSYPLFLVSDGSEKLQARKISSLTLGKWIEKENIAISGMFGAEFQKPSTYMAGKVRVLSGVNSEHVLFFGDREVDRDFAKNAGFHFVKVKCMHWLGE